MKKCTKVLALALSAVLLSACQNPFDTDDDDDATKAYLLQYYLSQRSGSTSGSSDSESASSSDSSSTDSSSSNSASENSSDSTSSDSNSSESSDSTSENANSTSESSNSTSDSTNSSESSSDGNGTSSENSSTAENSSSNSSSADENSSGASSENSSSENSGNSSSSSSSDGNSGDSSSAATTEIVNYVNFNVAIDPITEGASSPKAHMVNHVVCSSELPNEVLEAYKNGKAALYLGYKTSSGKWEETSTAATFYENSTQKIEFSNAGLNMSSLTNLVDNWGNHYDFSGCLKLGRYYLRFVYNMTEYKSNEFEFNLQYNDYYRELIEQQPESSWKL